jgi:Anti-sigma-K factor rskA
MSEERRVSSEDLALFAMQLLSEEETAEVAAYLAQSAEARRELAEIQGELAIYAHTTEMHSPPAQARERLMKQLAREKKAIPIDRPVAAETPAQETPVRTGSVFADVAARIDGAAKEGPLGGRGLDSSDYLTEDVAPKRSVAVLPWIGWAVAAGLAVAAGDFYREREALRGALTTQASQIDHLTADAAAARQVLDTMTDSSAMRVTLTKGQVAPVPTGRATYVASKGMLVFLASNLEPLQPAKTYELWLIPAAEGASPMPAGMFHPDARGNASVILPPLPKGVEAKAFGVTVEDEGGAATPTMPILLAGE